ncbi:MAG: phenylalanine--tRNA ligase subunit alpha [Candidatus Aminicenantes bacterium RBG_16_63_16]|nr:MAG: phenylalanine--tRNA ligase subunit alpha [Candidatus Aminicenantes bacterium RBG_16_63_16]
MKTFEGRAGELRKKFDEALARVKDRQALENLRNEFLSRKRGLVTLLFEELKTLPAEEKPGAGKLLNELKSYVQEKMSGVPPLEVSVADDIRVRDDEKKGRNSPPAPDPTLPGDAIPWGTLHPLTIFEKEIENIFRGMGFSVAEGPEIETEYYNFEALNFPPHHPARDDWDTLYLGDNLLLRTHTSPMQIRVMEKRRPPIRIIVPGKVYRREAIDATHLPMFYQVEGLLVDEGVTFAHLKGTLDYFLRTLLGDKIEIRFRPSFFPFTEPSAEVDVSCLICRGENAGCPVCSGTGWKELLGAGMVDPQVLKNVNIDPEKYSGWAFGMGIERTAMLSYQISHMLAFYDNDLRFIRQFDRK